MFSRLAWFATKNGRYTMGFVAATAASSTFIVSFIPQTIMLDKFHDWMMLRKFEVPVAISPHLRRLWNQVLDDLSLVQYQKGILKPFLVFGFDCWHAGTLKSKYGSIIGLPINFTYTDVEKIDKEQIQIYGEPINWDRPDARNLLESLTFSDDAKKYAMAREILMTNNINMYVQSIGSALILGASYVCGVQLNESFSMFQKPRFIRVIMYSIIGGFFWGCWAMQKDALTRHFEYATDECVSELGVNYVRGAIEFYDKTMKRNIALRSLHGSGGEKMFTAGGNTYYFIRMKNLPLSHRKSFFENKLKMLETASTDGFIAITANELNIL